jgi:iron complex outermembrane receptor protein
VSYLELLLINCWAYKFMNNVRSNFSTSLSVAIILMFASIETMAAKDQPETPKRKRVIEEIMVTATKRERSVRELPISIDAFTGEDLVERGIVSLENLIELSPGVTFTNRAEADGQSINIRGIGTSFAARFYNRPYGFFYEDVALINPTVFGVQPAIEPFDMATVEILKGPQGTLFGGSGLIGAVRYSPAKPDFDGFRAIFSGANSQFSDSDDKGKEYNAMINLPLIEDVVAARYTITDRHEAGYIDDLNNERDDVNSFDAQTWRAQLAWNITSNFSALASVLERTLDQPDAATSDYPDRYETDNKYFLEPSNSLVEMGIINLNWAPRDDFDITVVASQLDKSMVQNRDASGNIDTEDTGVRGTVPIKANSEQTTLEARMAGSIGADCRFWLFCNTDYLIGAVQSEADQFVQVGSNIAAPPSLATIAETVITEIDALTEEEAIFFDITRHFREGIFVLNIGGRYFKQHTGGANLNSARIEAPVASEVPPIAPLLTQDTFPPESVDQNVEEFNPKIAFTWNANDDLAFFTSAVRGFRFGGINVNALQSDAIPLEFEPDSVWNYELGMRSEWFDGQFLADITAYFIKWENAQQGLYDTSRIGAVAYINNFGGSTVKGAEFNFRVILPFGFDYSLSGAYNDARNDEAFQARDAEAKKGDINPGSPLWTGNTNINWKGYLGNFNIGANIGFTYQGVSKNSWEIPIDVDQIDSVNASIRVANETWPGKPALSLTAVNLENDINVSSYTSDRGANNTLEDKFYFLSSPRKISLRLQFTFD